MTSIVRSQAHCGESKEMVIKILRYRDGDEPELISERVIQNGEVYEACVYDDRYVVAFERVKTS